MQELEDVSNGVNNKFYLTIHKKLIHYIVWLMIMIFLNNIFIIVS